MVFCNRNEKDRPWYAQELVLPIRRDGEWVVVATADPAEKTFALIQSRWGKDARIVVTAKFDIIFALQKGFCP